MTVTLEVRLDGLTFANGQQRSHLRWTAFSRLTEAPEFFLLGVGPSGSRKVVPKRAFASKEQSDWFRTVASQQIAFAAHLVTPHLLPQLQTSQRTDVAQSPATITFAPHYTLRDCLDLVFATWPISRRCSPPPACTAIMRPGWRHSIVTERPAAEFPRGISASRAYAACSTKRCISGDDTPRWFRQLLEIRLGRPSSLCMIW